MSKDIRISTGFPGNVKTRRLYRKLGGEGVKSLFYLWIYAGEHHPDGCLAGMTIDMIEEAAEWSGEPGVFISTLQEVDTRFLDDCNGVLMLHDWEEHNPYAAQSKQRALKARRAAAARWNIEAEIHDNAKTESSITTCNAHQKESNEGAYNTECNDQKGKIASEICGAASFFDQQNAPTFLPSDRPTNQPTKKKKNKEVATNDKTTFDATKAKFIFPLAETIAIFQEKYPAVNVAAEIRQMEAWALANPANRKSNWMKFINSWLIRAQDKARPISNQGGSYGGSGRRSTGVDAQAGTTSEYAGLGKVAGTDA